MATATASPAPVVVDPARITESLAQHRAQKLRKSGAKWRQLISGLFDDDPHSRASAGKNFLRDRDSLVQQMNLSEEQADADLTAMSEFVRLEKKVEAYDHDQRSHLEKRANELPGELEKAVECLRTTNEMLQRLGIERQKVRMDLHVAGESRERLRSMVLANPRLFDAPAPKPAAAKPAVTVKPTPSVGGKQPILLDELSADAHPSPIGGDRQEPYDPLSSFSS